MEKEVIVEADIIPVGWVSLGKFDFPVGKAQVILDDRGGEIEADAEDKSAGLVQVHGVPDDKLPVKKQLIIADAVKLVRVKE